MTPVPSRDDRPVPRQRVGPADEDRVRAAAEELRDRTMSFETPAAATSWLFGAAVVVAVAILVILLLVYRLPLQTWLRQLGS